MTKNLYRVNDLEICANSHKKISFASSSSEDWNWALLTILKCRESLIFLFFYGYRKLCCVNAKKFDFQVWTLKFAQKTLKFAQKNLEICALFWQQYWNLEKILLKPYPILKYINQNIREMMMYITKLYD